jgi:lipopolysaccharide assembly protein A
MATLIVTVLMGLALAYFATFNTQAVSINLANNLLVVPLYMLVIVSILIGLLVSAIISSIDSISSAFALKSRDSQIRQKEKTVEALEQRIHDLEIENAKLKGLRGVVTDHDLKSEHRRSFLDRFRTSAA